MNSADLRDPRG